MLDTTKVYEEERCMRGKIWVCVIVVLCCIAMSSGCRERDELTKELVLVRDNTCQFVIIGDSEAEYMESFVAGFETMTGMAPEVYSPEEASEDLIHILAGTPEEMGAEALLARVPYFGYLICTLDDNIYILAYNADILEEAVAAFLSETAEFYSDGEMVIPKDYTISQSVSEAFPVSEVPYLEGGENARVFDVYDSHEMVLVEGVQESEFDAYCSELISNGYQLYSENEMNGNLFRTYYTEDGIMLHTYWIEYFEEVRTIVAKDVELPIQNTETDIVCTPLLHQLEALNAAKVDGGMGYIIRLTDGRFLIIDGGENTTANVKAIYSFLKEQAPDPEHIVIAAWYVSHAHSDHWGAFGGFAETYYQDSTITLESILFNACDTWEQMRYSVSDTAEMEETCKKYYPEVPVYKPLTGQVYTFATTTLEILYTMSDFLPNTIQQESDVDTKGNWNGDYNVQSMVCIVDIDSTADKSDRVCFLADTTTVACNEMCYRYGDYLKCDIVQVAHHGLAPLPNSASCRRHNGTKEIYELIDPDVALWPTSEAKVAERIELEPNEYLASIVDEIIIAGAGGHTFVIE